MQDEFEYQSAWRVETTPERDDKYKHLIPSREAQIQTMELRGEVFVPVIKTIRIDG